MRDEERINPGHKEVRSVLRVIGPAILAIGVLCMAIGMISFFSSFGGMEPPKYFWCCFLGIPLMFVGGVISKMAFLGAVSRYVAGEAAPVGKDTFNYLASETKEGVRDLAGAVASGISGGFNQTESRATCSACGAGNEADAKFCDQCGGAMSVAVDCPRCGAENDADARFCDNCGNQLS